ncbi:hypothetical protein P167DRAFT_543814 [Morchella conica CCBAS932]|uniref:Glycoside hydrolase family 31 TIM barrel domain-containing protein n=1 Tax=Morchella conica CCBAS932 TaxID=1392247 RepID=A0A3N4KUK6_9PEZI|nr:hypothetical protein P167DRAFT_543814 [Morchella conica CCBAS932]
MTELQDSHNFLLPEEFSQSVKRGEFKSPTKIIYNPEDNLAGNPVIKTRVLLRLQVGDQEEQPLFLLQFARPKVWRIRFDPDSLAPEQYDDYNSRTIISDTLSNLIRILGCAENIVWRTKFDAGSDLDPFYVFKTVQYPTKKDLKAGINGRTITELNIYKNEFKIETVRSIEGSGLGDPPVLQGATSKAVSKRKVVWETTGAGLSWKKTGAANATLLTAKKPGSARYLGWGDREQGGKEFSKKSTLMNYFNFDNMTYSSVYNQGPLDEREPLYHSEPFWLEVNGLPNYKTSTARSWNALVSSLDMFLAIIKDTLMCLIIPDYGYDTRKKVLKFAHAYNDRDTPLDGIHIDVDLQDGLRTFTIDVDRKFPRPKEMFDELRSRELNVAQTSLLHFILDKRYDDGNGVIPPHEVEYVCYENGIKLNIDPVNEMGQFPGADYNFVEWYNSGKPYRGGVGYGGTLGAG